MSPRRSSRARTTQPPTGSEHTLSSASSTTSSRAERPARSVHKTSSPAKSVASRSPSSEAGEEARRPAHSEPPQTRRRKRDVGEGEGEGDDVPGRHASAPRLEGEGEDEADEEEEEVTRCVCGQLDYPGPPALATIEPKPLPKDDADPDTSAASIDPLPEDAGGLFIQCDICKVWQHGGCVGIMDQAMTPDEYFCELCRKDLHRVSVGPTGQRSSRYLPVLESGSARVSRASSQSKEGEVKTRKGKSIRPPPRSDGGKRRSTMNSRDAAYDEEEQLRRAIEESKVEKALAREEGSIRKGKRSRGDSEETRQGSTKRQRTGSSTPSSPLHANGRSHSPALEAEEDDSMTKISSQNGPRKIRGAAARNHREKELREREKERERADAAGRRKGRAERRRGDDSDPSDEYPPSRPASTKDGVDRNSHPPELPSSSQPPPETPPSHVAPVNHTSSHTPTHRKTGRPPARRGRVGRNQYTRDRDMRNEPHGERDGSREREGSRDGRREGANGTNGHTSHHHGANGGEASKPSKPKYLHPQRTSINEMKRRVAAILEFISRTQVEMAGEQTPPSGSSETATATLLRGLASELPAITGNGRGGSGTKGSNATHSNGTGNGHGGGDGVQALDERDFTQLSSLEMMDVLTRKLVLWQKEFGKYGEK
ncbi:MAG: hypothetical protein M1838_005922 [Thelocarpon superellum]|nr:MAG: hypothetical protein M1838_005922 [Thelocarpon superellum]